MAVAIIHYASAPVIGGVETTIAQHARFLTSVGYSVRIISGRGGVTDPRFHTIIDPLFGSSDAQILDIKRELDVGRVTDAFTAFAERIEMALRAALAGVEVCIVHNVHTMHKNLAFTAALHRISAEANAPRMIAWCHDLAWTNPLYAAELHAGYPYELLRTIWKRTRYVTVSEARQEEAAEMFGVPRESIQVIPPGVDLAQFFHWTDTTEKIVDRFRLLDAYGIFLLPARLTRRKNIALALQIMAEMRRQSGHDYRLIVTGPPGPHNPANPGYLGELLALCESLGLSESAHFLYQLDDPPLIPDDDTMSNLYQIADALIFPSTQEGFGIPLLEAGIAGLPIFCADIPPFRQIGGSDVTFFDPVNDPPKTIARQIIHHLETDATARMRARVRRDYRWDSIVRRLILPLLEGV